jgi:Uma2 family endonuclease
MEAVMTTTSALRWTSADLEALPEDGKRYEIIEGELLVSKQPSWFHQRACTKLAYFLITWDTQSKLGYTNTAPGLIFDEDEDVAPDAVWISKQRLDEALAPDGKLHAAPELVIEALSPGPNNAQRDRQAKLKLYSRRAVSEYWILNWQIKQIEIYRREQGILKHTSTLLASDELVSPLLPGFRCVVGQIFE